LSTGIAPEKIMALYFWTRKMISHVHTKEQEWIRKLESMCITEVAGQDSDY